MILDLLKDNIASEETQKERIKKCKECENYRLLYCAECGCALSLKIRLNKAKCPIDKWGKENAV